MGKDAKASKGVKKAKKKKDRAKFEGDEKTAKTTVKELSAKKAKSVQKKAKLTDAAKVAEQKAKVNLKSKKEVSAKIKKGTATKLAFAKLHHEKSTKKAQGHLAEIKSKKAVKTATKKRK